MIRILLLLVLVWLLYLILRQFLSNVNPKKPAADTLDRFIKCSQCGCHTPELEAQTHGDLLTCTHPDCINNARKTNVNKTNSK